MANADALAEFKHGVDLLQNGYPEDAMGYFRSAVEAEKQNPYYLSFLGISVARAQKKYDPALQLCKAALQLKRDEPQFYLNLAEVYVSAGQAQDAIALLDSALKRLGNETRIKRLRNDLGRRGNPVLPFLPRTNFLNRNLGQLRHQVLARVQKPGKA